MSCCCVGDVINDVNTAKDNRSRVVDLACVVVIASEARTPRKRREFCNEDVEEFRAADLCEQVLNHKGTIFRADKIANKIQCLFLHGDIIPSCLQCWILLHLPDSRKVPVAVEALLASFNG